MANKDSFGPLPRLHPRERIVRKAENDLRSAVIDIVHKAELTTGESLQVVNGALSGWIAGVAKHAIREERHPGEPDKPGGFA